MSAARIISFVVAWLLAGPAFAFAPWEAPATVRPQFLGKSRPKGPPKRIASLAPSVTELIFELGAGARVVGVTRYDDFPPEVLALPKLGGFLDPNAEAVIAVRPDLVVAVPNAQNRPTLERLAALGLVVLVVPGNSFADLFHAAAKLGEVLGAEASRRSRALAKRVRAETLEIRAAIEKKKRPRVAFVYDQRPLVLAGPGSFAHTVLEILNAENVVTIDDPYPRYSMERLIVDAPDVIFDASFEHGRKLAFWQTYPTIPAVRRGRVHATPGTSVFRPGPRLLSAIRTLAAALYGLD